MTEARDDEELRKRITSLLLCGSAFGVFDNATRRVVAGPLAALLTATTWTDRILGANRMVRLPIRATWITTGNNLQFSREMRRRAVWVRLDARVEEPWRRTASAFRHTPLEPWVQAHRGLLVWACLILGQRWIAAGRPPGTGPALGSFEAWASTIGGILTCAGIPGFLSNLDEFGGAADAETLSWREFMAAWWDAHRNSVVTVGDLFPLALQYLDAELGGGQERSQRIRLGLELRRRVGWIISGLRIANAQARDDSGRERAGYSLSNIGGLGTSGAGASNSANSQGASESGESPNVSKTLGNVKEDVGAPNTSKANGFGDFPQRPNVEPASEVIL
jgi:hypothetical protein